ncbi:MAG TPA: hypothetical protein VMY77_00535 [Chitinophagaceae bacterium]|nr:hypothetical protein [Chitinophagaceae bacterium]
MKKFLFLALSLSFTITNAQKRTAYDFKTAIASSAIEVYQREIKIDSSTKTTILIANEAAGKGIIWLKDIKFDNGIIELDIKGRDVLQKSFVGIAFHGINDTIYESVYFRPFNFRATDSVRKIHAVQYMSMPQNEWSKLRAQFNGQYEKAVINAPSGNDWFHAKIEITKELIKVYVNNESLPSLVVQPLTNTAGLRFGLWMGEGADGNFANLSILNK